MNNIIKKLKEQATEDVSGVPVLNSTLFAELIVKDCISVMKEYGQTYAHPSAGEYQAESFSEVIRKHFGVE